MAECVTQYDKYINVQIIHNILQLNNFQNQCPLSNAKVKITIIHLLWIRAIPKGPYVLQGEYVSKYYHMPKGMPFFPFPLPQGNPLQGH